MKKILILALTAFATLQASAQWRIGVNVGESVGIEPDIEVDLDREIFDTTGYDTQLDRALQYIENPRP